MADPGKFEAKFGAGMDELQQMIEAGTVTIPSMMDVCPPGTVDPTAMIYDSTMCAPSTLLVLF